VIRSRTNRCETWTSDGDLKAAADCSVRTGFIYHPNEFWRRRLDRKINPSEFDIASEDTIDLAKQMGA